MRRAFLIAAALAAVSTAALAQGNPFDIRAREDAERARSNYQNSLQNYNAARQRENDARIRSQMLPDPVPVPAINPANNNPVPPGVNADPALRIQQEDAARLQQWQADQAKRDADNAAQAARDAKRNVPR